MQCRRQLQQSAAPSPGCCDNGQTWNSSPQESGSAPMPRMPEQMFPYYKAKKPEDSDWVVLPSSAFNNYFGSTVFIKKVLPKITGVIIQRSEISHGIGRYRVLEEFL